MSQSKKYDYRLVQEPAGWSAEIVRRVSAKKLHVSKRQDGFSSEAEARAWGESEVKAFLTRLNQKESAKRRARKEEAQQP